MTREYFQYFSSDVSQVELPSKFTFPFYYDPHPLCLIAVEEVQNYLKNQTDFKHNFGVNSSAIGLAIGKMFGVLIVQNKKNEIGYITAVSGKLADKNDHILFVPPVYDMITLDSFYQKEKKALDDIYFDIQEIEGNENFIRLSENFLSEQEKSKIDINNQKNNLKAAKKTRDSRRKEAELSNNYTSELETQLKKESLESKHFFNNVNRYWEHILDNLQKQLEDDLIRLEYLKKLRKTKSIALQEYINSQYQFLNQSKERKNLSELFEHTSIQKIPAGSGECAAPKLLQYAFLNDLKPIAMAEFWWGNSPNKEIRKHGQYYPSCQGKCKPILTHMLGGIEMDMNPMLENPAVGKELEIIFEDEHLLVVNKPHEFLSVPGIHIQDSVYTRIKQQIKDISGPIIVHRLDMSTSGLLLLAKNKKVHKKLQSQFIDRSIKKRYTALLDGIIEEIEGEIDLPLRGDLNDRPRQLVCFDQGKTAKTKWERLEVRDGKTKIHFYPISGRTHQLRVHASHLLGLHTPIIGDDLYGTKADRLYLHADSIEFIHPVSKKIMTFNQPAFF